MRVANRWSEVEPGADELDLCVTASRLLGQDPHLVLFGGGNSSVKTTETDVFGEPVETLWVKGSGWDMGSIERAGFAPLQLDRVARLAELDELSDARMAGELRGASTDVGAPAPSVESILHALLPHRFVLHTHADAVLALTNTPDGAARLGEAYGDDVVIVPYVMPGFVLAKLCAELYPKEAHPGTLGMALLNHGLFTFADDARTAYDNHVELVNRAAELAGRRSTGTTPRPGRRGLGGSKTQLAAISRLRQEISAAAGRPMILRSTDDEACRRFAARDDLARVSQQGPATPDHVLRTKRVPLLGRDVGAYVDAYRAYVDRHRHRLGDREIVPVDPAPRVVVDADLGVLAAGPRVQDAVVAHDIYRHTLGVIEAAEALGGYRSVAEADLFDVEYWELEQAKLARQGAPPPMSGEVAVVTGTAAGIGRACTEALLAEGAAVVGIDIDAAVHDLARRDEFVGIEGDAAHPDVVAAAVRAAVESFGGVDMVVVNAGIFPPVRPLAELDTATWDKAIRVNATAALELLTAAHPFLAMAPNGGRAVVVGSKNVPAPGRGAAAYSASKAALTQLARAAALEWGEDGVRVNVVHPDAVFDTNLWDDSLIAERAASYGLTPEAYRRRNVLRSEVSSGDVAAAVVALCSPAFARTTGAQIPLDGGNDRVI